MGKIGKIISDKYGIEESIVDDAAKITVVGGENVFIENHGGIIFFSADKLQLMSGVSIEGENICIKDMDSDTINVSGKVFCIKIERNLKNC